MNSDAADRKYQESEDLLNVRVLQRNLVYAVGIPVEFAREDLLRSKSLFGGFGEIVKIVLSKRKESKPEKQTDGIFSAYITYLKEEYAVEAIREMDGFRLGDKAVRCTFGTTKYCSFFLRKIKCSNEGCLYLHEKGREEDSFARDQMFVLKTKIEKIIEERKIEEKTEIFANTSTNTGASANLSLSLAPSSNANAKTYTETENIEELSALFLFKPEQALAQKHYDSCQFNPFYRRTSEDSHERSVRGICVDK
ncbi:CCR4-NOT transcription complex subunit 4 [Nematocida minor]|uniref:CCR4-NOT transcription complex subunit 4 n=1 Tax=Nematocida minor TaxID=1912983 RepID=UPI00221FB3C5|nr:CCR4-NOT transcription complex subunit 4 [Nematocida minor]KAI5191922.1 CCR4-NOT transcription complex subunit 4 [Nematocida minor]